MYIRLPLRTALQAVLLAKGQSVQVLHEDLSWGYLEAIHDAGLFQQPGRGAWGNGQNRDERADILQLVTSLGTLGLYPRLLRLLCC